VGVIVQKAAARVNLAGLITRLGGAVTQDLRIINAFAAELPAVAVPVLTRT